MFSKNELRSRIIILRKYVKVSVLAKEFGLSHTTLSKFLSNETFNYMINIEKLNMFYNFCLDSLNEIT